MANSGTFEHDVSPVIPPVAVAAYGVLWGLWEGIRAIVPVP